MIPGCSRPARCVLLPLSVMPRFFRPFYVRRSVSQVARPSDFCQRIIIRLQLTFQAPRAGAFEHSSNLVLNGASHSASIISTFASLMQLFFFAEITNEVGVPARGICDFYPQMLCAAHLFHHLRCTLRARGLPGRSGRFSCLFIHNSIQSQPLSQHLSLIRFPVFALPTYLGWRVRVVRDAD